MIDVPHDTETLTIINQTPAWPPEPPETDEFMALSPESGKFLSGPGVIPVQGAVPMPQAVGHDHEENLNATQYPDPPVSIPLPTSDQPATSLTLAEAKLKFKLEPNMSLSQDPDGKLVIQELDSPVTRREKAMRRKRARSKLEAPVISACSALEGSDLSSLSELSEDDGGNVHIKKKIDKTEETRSTQPGQVALVDGKMLDGGTLGKCSCFHMPITADFRT
jgi:NuA3 HAT complex component NTO1